MADIIFTKRGLIMNTNYETSWPIYEANVQSYRSNFISSQSFMLAVAAMVLEKSFVLIF